MHRTRSPDPPQGPHGGLADEALDRLFVLVGGTRPVWCGPVDGPRNRGRAARQSVGTGSFSGILWERGASPRIIRAAAPVSLRYQSDGSPS